MAAKRFKGRALVAPEVLWLIGLCVPVGGLGVAALMGPPVPTTINDYFAPGTQPHDLNTPIQSAQDCMSCHGDFDDLHEPFRPWAASMMGQAARDPLFHAALTIANQDASFAGDMCLRCHTPTGWLAGRSTPTDGSLLEGADFEGVNCNFCHRMVDPIHNPGVDPAVDAAILSNLMDVPTNPHSGQFVVDPEDRRRGPHDLGKFPYHEWIQAPFQSSSQMCATCHDVSNPVFEKQPDGTYMPGAFDTPAASHDPYDQFPIERTYSEWSQSAFATGPVDVGGRFAPNLVLGVSSCQDCHMPPDPGVSCFFGEYREELSTHQFRGGNTWMLNAIRNLYPDSETFLTDDSVSLAIQQSETLLAQASDMTLTQDGSDMVVRITNYSAHKLPTGYPEGKAPGESFHFVLNNEWLKDNRIPPMGFTNAGFTAVQAGPVAYTYADGQHWDDTTYDIPSGAVRAEVKLYYQTASKEYIEFLRDENVTDNKGQIMYDQWVANDKGPPILMDDVSIVFETPCLADTNGDGFVTPADFSAWVAAYNTNAPACDQNGDGICSPADFSAWVGNYNAGCP